MPNFLSNTVPNFELRKFGDETSEDLDWFASVAAGHASCLKLSPAVIQTVKLTRWQCQDCKTCTVCKASQSSNKHRSAVCCHFYINLV